ncbi:MAG: rRNA maturation RNase YbeY [Candidatus Brocadiia bacterium]
MLRVKVSDRRKILRNFRAQVVRLLRLAAPREWAGGELSLAVVDGREMTRLNRRFTGRRGQTDVLAFPLADGPSPAPQVVGEIVVNASLAAREARRRGAQPIHELTLYTLHGALHLAGYDDHTPQDRSAMYAREEQILRRAGIPYTRRLPKLRRTPASPSHVKRG